MRVNGFDTHVRCEWPNLGENKDDMYLTSKYTKGREKQSSSKVGKRGDKIDSQAPI